MKAGSLRGPALAAGIGCAICIGLGLIPLFMGTFPVFLKPVSMEFGWGFSVFPQSMMVVGVTGALAGPFFGRLVDRYGVRRFLAPGIVLWCTALFSMSLLNGKIVSLYLVAILIGLGGTLAGPITYLKVVGGWFDRNRGLALGLVASGAPAVTTAVAIIASQQIIEIYDWRNAYRALAVVALVVSLPTALLLVRERPAVARPDTFHPAAEGLTAGEALRTVDFWLVIGASCLAAGALMSVSSHFAAWMSERGVSTSVTTLALSLYSLAGPVGPLVGGLLLDRVRSPKILAAFFMMPLFGILMLLYGGSAGIVPGMVLLGLGFSSILGFAPYLVSRYFGMKCASEILGITFAVLTVAMGVAPVGVGLVHDLLHGYDLSMAVLACVIALAFGGSLLFRPYRFAAPGRPEASQIVLAT